MLVHNINSGNSESHKESKVKQKKKKVIEEQNKPNYDNREIHEHEYSIKLKKKVLYNKQK